MARNTGSLATAADTVVLSQGNRAGYSVWQLSGTYASAVVKFEGSTDGTNYFALASVLLTDASTKTGNQSPTDNSKVAYLVASGGVPFVRVYLVSISTGSVSVVASSDDTTPTLPFVPTAATAAAVEAASADGAIATKNGVVIITKGSAAALTLAAPSAGTDDGKRLLIVTSTAFAHTVTQTTPGINNGGIASDVATFTGAAGNGMELVAYNGVWYTVSLRNVALG